MVSRDVRRAAFAQFVERVLREARERGLTNADVERLTGVPRSTYYRWRAGDWARNPDPQQVQAFCGGLGVPFESAQRALGWATDPAGRSDELEIDPDVRAILRQLADPNVPAARKQAIRQILRLVASSG